MSWGCHRAPSPPRAALHPRAEPWINLPAGMSFTCFLPVQAHNIFVFMFPQKMIPKWFGFAQFTWDLLRARYFWRFVSYDRKWVSLGFPVSRVIVGLVYLSVSWIMWVYSFPHGFLPARKQDRQLLVSHTIILLKTQLLSEFPGAINSH